MKKLLVFTSRKKVMEYVAFSDKGYDIIFYLVFIIQTSVLPAIPSGYHSPNFEGWLAFSISFVFFLSFYPWFYFSFYKNKEMDFVREVVIFSVVARFNSFFYTGCIAVLQMSIWSFLKWPKVPNSSLIYYLLYYFIFARLMVLSKKNL